MKELDNAVLQAITKLTKHDADGANYASIYWYINDSNSAECADPEPIEEPIDHKSTYRDVCISSISKAIERLEERGIIARHTNLIGAAQDCQERRCWTLKKENPVNSRRFTSKPTAPKRYDDARTS